MPKQREMNKNSIKLNISVYYFRNKYTADVFGLIY